LKAPITEFSTCGSKASGRGAAKSRCAFLAPLAYGRARTVARVLGIDPKLVAYALNRLAREKVLALCEPASGLPRDCYVLSDDNLLD